MMVFPVQWAGVMSGGWRLTERVDSSESGVRRVSGSISRIERIVGGGCYTIHRGIAGGDCYMEAGLGMGWISGLPARRMYHASDGL